MPRRQAVFVKIGVEDGDKAIAELKKIGIQGEKALGVIEKGSKPASRGLLALDAAGSEVQGTLRGFAATAGPAGAVLGALGPAGLAAAAGIGALVLGLRSGLRAAREALGDATEIANTADKIGLATDALQELRFAGEQVGVGQNTTDLALQRFSRRVGEAAQGTGELKDTLNQYGIAVRDADGRTRALDDVLRDYADAVKNADSDQERLRLGFKAFDSEGAALVGILRDGGQGLDALRARAQELGVVLDEQTIREAERMNNKLQAMERVIDTNLNRVLLEMAPLLVAIAQAAADAARFISDLVDAFQDLEDKTTRNLVKRRAELVKALDVSRSEAGGLKALGLVRDPAAIEADIARIDAILKAREEAANRPRATLPTAPTLSDLKGAGASAKTLEAQRKANADLVAQLQFEGEQLGKTERQRSIDTALRRLNAQATEAQRAKVAELAGSLYDQARAAQRNEDAIRARQALFAEGERVTLSVMTATERYNAELERLGQLLQSGAIDQETFGRAAEAAKQQLEGINDQVSDLETFNEGAGRTLAGGFFDAATGARDLASAIGEVEQGLLGVANQIIQNNLADFFTRLLDGKVALGGGTPGGISGATGGGATGGSAGGGAAGFFSGVTDLFDSVLAAIFHAGGTAGGGGRGRAVPALAFAGAPRLARGSLPGLGPDEIPAILHRREIVLNAAQSDRLRGAGGPSGGGLSLAPGAVNITVMGDGGRDPRFTGEQLATGFMDRVDSLMRQR